MNKKTIFMSFFLAVELAYGEIPEGPIGRYGGLSLSENFRIMKICGTDEYAAYRGVRYLLPLQHGNGSWSDNPDVTTVVVEAIETTVAFREDNPFSNETARAYLAASGQTAQPCQRARSSRAPVSLKKIHVNM